MKIISHRGNLDGRIPKLENTPEQIDKAHLMGYDVEIDVWYIWDKWYLGHDAPEHEITKKWLRKRRKWLWCHAKNLEAMPKMIKEKLNCFWHENDKMTMTSKQILWCYPDTYIKDGITVVKEKIFNSQEIKIKGICTDYPLFFDDLISQ